MSRSRTVYSTAHGRMCPDCERPRDRCACDERARPAVPASDGTVRVSRETKGRRGKGVTVVTGVPLAGAELKAFAKELKQRCGSGGTVRDGTIEIQGDHRDRLVEEIGRRGWKVKRQGG